MYAHSSECKVSQLSGSYAASEIKTPGLMYEVGQ